MKACVRVVTCGSVDDGKSTLLGRLLTETGSLPNDQIESARTLRRTGSTIPVGDVDYSLVTDGLEAEREQGITIDVAYRHLLLPSGRRAILADAPGHEQYTRNMAVAASTADIAILLADALRGTRAQTHRHLTVCALLGVKHVLLAVNKMDAIDYDQETYQAIVDEVTETAHRLEVPHVIAVPVSALAGANVMEKSDRTPWYDGPTVLGALDSMEIHDAEDVPARLPIQTILRADNFRGYGGLLSTGTIKPGMTLKVSGSGQVATVTRLLGLVGEEPVELDSAIAGRSVAIELDRDIDITRGDLLAEEKDCPKPADRFSADMVWLAEEPLAHGRSYTLRCGPIEVPATVTTIRYRLDVTTGAELAARTLAMNEIGRVELATNSPIPLDVYQHSHDTGGFVLVDRVTGDSLAAGMTKFALRRSANVVEHNFQIDRTARESLNGNKGGVVWFTGLSGSGKSTIADAVERRLMGMGIRSYVLDGDAVRHGLSKDLGFTEEDRAENVRRVAEVARIMVDAGLVVLVCLVSPFRADRRAARSLFETDDFLEAYVDTPIEVCMERDPKGLYARTAAGDIPNMSGVGQDYEQPTHAEIWLSGTGELDEQVNAVLARLGFDE